MADTRKIRSTTIIVIAGGALLGFFLLGCCALTVIVMAWKGIGPSGGNIDGGGGASASTEDFDKTFALMSAQAKKMLLVRAKKNEFASTAAEKEMEAELAKIEGKEVKWKLQVQRVNAERIVFMVYHLYDDGSAKTELKGKGLGIAKVFCSVFAEDNPRRGPDKAVPSGMGSDMFAGGGEIGKVVSQARAKRLAEGDFVTITGKVHACRCTNSGVFGRCTFELCLIQAKVIE